MARVDPADDSIERFIVWHYRYDSGRRERRHVVVAAFENEREFDECLRGVTAEINARRARGERIDASERASGVRREPGYLRRAANGRLVRRAVAHGVAGGWVEELDLPSYLSFSRADRASPGSGPAGDGSGGDQDVQC